MDSQNKNVSGQHESMVSSYKTHIMQDFATTMGNLIITYQYPRYVRPAVCAVEVELLSDCDYYLSVSNTLTCRSLCPQTPYRTCLPPFIFPIDHSHLFVMLKCKVFSSREENVAMHWTITLTSQSLNLM